MQRLTLSSKNQVVIPKAVRSKLKIGGGDKLIVHRVTEKEVVLKKEPRYHDFLGIVPRQAEDPVKRIRDLRDNWRGSGSGVS